MKEWFVMWNDGRQIHKRRVDDWESGTIYIDVNLRHATWCALTSKRPTPYPKMKHAA